MNSDLELKASVLVEKVKHYLVTTLDRVLEEATDQELFRALSLALREEIIINWAATRRSLLSHGHRIVYYLSMEYLPGRILANTITNLQSRDLVQLVVKKLGRDLPNLACCEQEPGLGNGGLGRLASCFLDSMATLRIPSMGYGLRYQYGIFEQEIWDGLQVERPDTWLLQESPWQRRNDFAAASVKYCGKAMKTANKQGEEVYDLHNYEEVRALPYDIPIIGYCRDRDFSVVTLRLWTTKESPRNFELQRYNAGRLDQAAENTTLTDVLYPNDVHETGKRVRLKQEFLLVSASVQDILRRYNLTHDSIDDFGDKVRIQINDTHPSLVIPELMRLLTYKHDVSWSKAWEMTQAVCGFTNHTVLKEAMEEWDQGLMRYLLPRQYTVIEHLNHQLCESLRKNKPQDEERVRRMSILEHGMVRMANLAIYGSSHINGVAALHTKILKNQTFPEWVELSPDRWLNVTNGVTPRRWILHCNPRLAAFFTARLGDAWITDLSQLTKLAPFAEDEQSQQEFLQIKRHNKERLIEALRDTNTPRDAQGRPQGARPEIDPASLFDVQIKRIHEYKRQLLAAIHAIMLYHELSEDPTARPIKRTLLIGGKAASGYRTAKTIIRLINCIARKVNADTTLNGALKVIYIQNYNVTRAERVIPAADLSEQISAAGYEASGTGNMKLSMNGALTIGTEDGANVEMHEHVTDKYWPFRFGTTAEEARKMATEGTYKPWEIYSKYPAIRRAIDSLRDRTFALTEEEHQAFSELHTQLIEGSWDTLPDRYYLLKDLPDYHATQSRVETLFAHPHEWAKTVLNNIARMGYFSTDRAIQEYSQKIWGVEPCPPDKEILAKIRQEYAEHAPTLTL